MLKSLCVMIFISEILMENLYSKFHQTDYKVDFEWAELIRCNKSELNVCEVRTFKYNRTCTAVNLTFKYVKSDVANDIEMIIQIYKFASNEYRIFPVHFQINYCEAIMTNVVGLKQFLKCGNFSGCPLRKEIVYHVCNWKPEESKFPPFVPNGRYMAEMQGLYHSSEVWVIKGYFTVFRPIVK